MSWPGSTLPIGVMRPRQRGKAGGKRRRNSRSSAARHMLATARAFGIAPKDECSDCHSLHAFRLSSTPCGPGEPGRCPPVTMAEGPMIRATAVPILTILAGACGGGGGVETTPCTSTAGCPSYYVCGFLESRGCSSTVGTCIPVGPVCQIVRGTFCACDGTSVTIVCDNNGLPQGYEVQPYAHAGRCE